MVRKRVAAKPLRKTPPRHGLAFPSRQTVAHCSGRSPRISTNSFRAEALDHAAIRGIRKRCATDRAKSADADIEMTRRKAFPAILRLRTVATENRLSKCSGRPLRLCGRRLPELNLIPIQVIDPGKATVGFIHSFGVNLYSLLF